MKGNTQQVNAPQSYTTTPPTPEQQQAAQKALAVKDAAIKRVANLLDHETVRARFAAVVGDRNVGAYVNSVMIAVRSSDQLQMCQPDSIYLSALRAATLRLSCDPATGQAYLVPFKGRCTLIVGYKGLYDMAVRTNKYRYINVGPIYDGMGVEENPITGFHTVVGQRKSSEIVGWIGAFEMLNGFAKTLYMTHDEIHAHAAEHSKSYGDSRSGWKTDTLAMERKTVLRLLLRRWGYLDPADVQTLNDMEDDKADAGLEEIYGSGEIVDAQAADGSPRSFEQNMHELGFD